MDILQKLDLRDFIFAIGTPILVGVILLFIEYRTKWFANRFLSEKTDTKNESLIGVKVTHLGELDNPIGDWIQIAEQVKTLLEKNTKPERSGSVSLLGIQPSKRKDLAKLTFAFWGDPPTDDPYIVYWHVYIEVTSDGRIVGYKREC